MVLDIIKRVSKFFFTFYTFRAIFLHLLFIIWLVPNTRVIALLVLVISQIFVFVWPNNFKKYNMWKKEFLIELILHWVRIFIIPFAISKESLMLLLLSLILYVILHWPRNIFTYYYYQKETKNKILYK